MKGKLYQKPLFDVQSNWELPTEFPNLASAKAIGLDTETCDPDLLAKGPGVRTNGYIVGISVGVPEGKQWYFPFGHAEGNQFDKEVVLRWAREELCRPNQPKVGANLLYDLDYLYHENVKVAGPFYDVQIAEPLIDENRRYYNLDSLSKDYLDEGKEEAILSEACQNRGLKGKPQAHIWKLPPKFVGMYAEADADRPLRIFKKQWKRLKEQNLLEVFDIETRLIPILLSMRQQGVKIDVKKLHSIHKNMLVRLDKAKDNLLKAAGQPVDYWAAESIGKLFDKLKLSYSMTAKTKKPSFTKLWLEHQSHPIAKRIVECRTLDKFIGTFLEGSLINMLIKVRIHCQFNQLKSDDTGTVTGRFSSSTPNLQFIPERDEELGPLIRSVFIPEEGEDWGRADYSQIELRILAHYAIGKGSHAIRERYRKDPLTDYHTWCAEEAKIPRKIAKTINFGIIYGMGKDLLAESLGITKSEAKLFMDVYFKDLPFLQETIQTAARLAEERGYVKTILNRRRRFNLWEPSNYKLSKKLKPLKDKTAMRSLVKKHNSWGVKRAKTYKAFNAVDQGTAADIMKKSMVDVWDAGICDILGPFLLTVHDELDVSIKREKKEKEAFKTMCKIMENTIKLKVPLIVDPEIKKNWGEYG